MLNLTTKKSYLLPKAILLYILLCLGGSISAQSFYKFQQDDTLIKASWYTQVSKQKQYILRTFTKQQAGYSDYKKIYEEHYDEIGLLLRSSRVVTDGQAHSYLQKMVQRIIEANPELQALVIRVMFMRDGVPNAYSLGDGTIAFNAGLLIQLDNEAEMIFVLCHELAHFYLDHSNKRIKNHVERINSASFKEAVKRLSKEEYMVNEKMERLSRNLLFDTRHHSRDNEVEADRYALKFMKGTGFDCMAIRTCLELLDTIDQRLRAQPLAVDKVLHFPEYPFKQKWIAKQSSIFSAMNTAETPLTKKEKDSLKTHPDCAQRIKLLSDSLAMINQGKKFLQDEQLFRKLQQDFPLEIMEESFRQEQLSLNLYQALRFLEQKREVSLAAYMVVRSLNEIYSLQKEHRLGDKVVKEDRFYPEDYNLLLRMIDRLRLEEIAALNQQVYKKYQQELSGYPGIDKEYRKLQEIVKNH